jgi:hypothetical protein
VIFGQLLTAKKALKFAELKELSTYPSLKMIGLSLIAQKTIQNISAEEFQTVTTVLMMQRKPHFDLLNHFQD